MKFPPALALTLGPLLLVSLCYLVAAPARPAAVPMESGDGSHESVIDADEWQRRCQRTAETLRQRSRLEWSILVQPPFVLTGDLSREGLEALYEETIAPTALALEVDYFDQGPRAPIALIVLSSDEKYRAAMKRFGHARREEYSGLYAREERTVILNLSTGAGTVAHELTHALAHADFPNMPEWFDEGLASLHEESEFSEDGRHLFGRDNWRVRFLHEAEQRGCWKPFERLLTNPFAEPDRAALDYALARYLCLYLQEHGVLSAYYRKCRGQIAHDATGREALLRIFPGQTLAEIDADFRAWLLERQ